MGAMGLTAAHPCGFCAETGPKFYLSSIGWLASGECELQHHRVGPTWHHFSGPRHRGPTVAATHCRGLLSVSVSESRQLGPSWRSPAAGMGVAAGQGLAARGVTPSPRWSRSSTALKPCGPDKGMSGTLQAESRVAVAFLVAADRPAKKALQARAGAGLGDCVLEDPSLYLCLMLHITPKNLPPSNVLCGT